VVANASGVPPEVAFVMRKTGVGREEATERLRRQDLATMVEPIALRQLGENFAGVWSDILTDEIVVATSGAATDLSALETDPRLGGHLRQRHVSNSLARLTACEARLQPLSSVDGAISVDGLDIVTNRVLIRQRVTDDHLPEPIRDTLRAESELIRIEVFPNLNPPRGR
jgi:hypothetical protein